MYNRTGPPVKVSVIAERLYIDNKQLITHMHLAIVNLPRGVFDYWRSSGFHMSWSWFRASRAPKAPVIILV